MRLIVDGMNVIGSRPTGWWRDRDAAARQLVSRVETLAAVTGDDVTVVLDGRPVEGLAEGPSATSTSVRVLYAQRRGRDAADDRVVELVSGDADRDTLTVATSDRALQRRVIELGASVEGAAQLLRRLDEAERRG